MITMNQEILLCLVALILFPFAAGGEANIQVHHPALLHGSVRMSYSPSQKMGTMHFISWKYTTKNGKRLSILDTTKIYPSPFTNRLQISDDFYTLTIMDLTIEDGGIYIIDATDTNGETEDNSFNVTIYEPTPQPTITTHMEEITKERCNVTLNCSVPSQTSDLSYTWKSRHRDPTYQLYSNGGTIQISAPPDHQDMELLCIVQSPADQKNVSISVTPCTGTGKKIITPRSRNHIIIPILIIIIVILAITVAVIYIRTKHKGSSEPKENRNAEIDYIEVTTQRLEDNQRIEVENDHYIGMPSPQKVKAETVYTTLQHPQPKYNR